ncbi:MAG: rhodanese-like domain-containing protein [Lachnospiraceae bacterium]|nr:rhodanese-like domain-containing protein [Lachnospiraceae bacterium]
MTTILSELFRDNVTKAEAARIVHEYLISVLDEKDEDDISAACRLRDIYDCHVCAGHVAQTYVKGIIAPDSEKVFGLKTALKAGEADMIVLRVLDRSKRIKVEPAGSVCSRILIREVTGLDSPRIIDVRSEECFENGHIDAAVNIPLERIYINPLQIAGNLSDDIVFVCDRGVKACLAAHLAAKAGYRNVYYSRYETGQ